MAKGIDRGVNGVARKVTSVERGISGIARNVVGGERGIGGVARAFWPSKQLDLSNATITQVYSVYGTYGGSWGDIIYDGTNFILVAQRAYDDPSYDYPDNVYSSYYSSNGSSWYSTSMPDGAYWNNLAAGDGVVIALAGGYYKGSAYSNNNGKTWVEGDEWSTQSPSGRGELAFGNNKFLCQWGNNLVYRTSSTNTWIGVDDDNLPTTTSGKQIAFGNGYFLWYWVDKRDSNAYRIYKSTSGTSGWTLASNLSKEVDGFFTYGNKTWIGLIQDRQNSSLTVDQYIYSKDDGATWTYGQFPKANFAPIDVTFTGKGFVVTGTVTNASDGVMYSDDGINWEFKALANSGGLITYGDNKLIIAKSGTPCRVSVVNIE